MQAFRARVDLPPKWFDDNYSDGRRIAIKVTPVDENGQEIGSQLSIAKADYHKSASVIESLNKGDTVWLVVAGKIPKGKNKGDPYYDVLTFVGEGMRVYKDPCRAMGVSPDATPPSGPVETVTGEDGQTAPVRMSGQSDLVGAYASAFADLQAEFEEKGMDVSVYAIAMLAAEMVRHAE